MAVKLFVIGRPGSGKTTAAHFIAAFMRDNGLSVGSINDYDLLKTMFDADIEHNKFLPTEHGGFDVLDFSVLDLALQELEKKVQELMSTVDLITIEFARDDYSQAMKQFNVDFLKDAYFLFIDADIDTCLVRIHKRVTNPKTANDHPSLSDKKFREHYFKDNKPYITFDLKSTYALDERQVMVIENMGSWGEFGKQLNECANVVFQELRNNILVPGLY